jgi:hypothetical protein
MVVISIRPDNSKGGRRVALLKLMEKARQRMLSARRDLDKYDLLEGTSAWTLIEHSRLSDELILATDEYIQLVAEFLHESSAGKKRHASRDSEVAA